MNTINLPSITSTINDILGIANPIFEMFWPVGKYILGLFIGIAIVGLMIWGVRSAFSSLHHKS